MTFSADTIALVIEAVEEDLETGMKPGLIADGPGAFEVDRLADAVPPDDVVTQSETVVTVPWRWRCIHEDSHFLGVAPTYQPLTLTGITIVVIDDPKATDGWLFWRCIDYLCALYELGVTVTRPALDPEQLERWVARQ